VSLPTFVRFKDLQSAGIVSSWVQLREMQARYAFPLGKMLSDNVRGWELAEVKDWLAQRPIETPPRLIKRLENSVVARQARRLKDQQTTAA
jgi:predicted DNA-binding transcriptional regulator AlpA